MEVDMKSFTKNQQYIMFGALVFVIGAVGFINFKLDEANQPKKTTLEYDEPDTFYEEETVSGDYFAVFRADRDDVRAREIEYLDSIITGGGNDGDTVKAAQEQKLALVGSMEKEVIIEGLLKAKGFNNAAVTLGEDSVNVIIDKGQLTDAEVAQVLDVARTETGEAVENIKVLPLNSKM